MDATSPGFQQDACRVATEILLLSAPSQRCQGLEKDPSPFDAEASNFPQAFDTTSARKPQACEKRKDLQEPKWGLMDEAYGNYTLIYHLGQGN